MADNQNYGNELGAFSLIYPSNALNGGLADEEYLSPRSADELFEIFGRFCHNNEDMFKSIFDYATRGLDSESPTCSAAHFLQAKRELEMKSMGF